MLVLMMSEQCYLSEDHVNVSWECRGIKKLKILKIKKGGGGGIVFTAIVMLLLD